MTELVNAEIGDSFITGLKDGLGGVVGFYQEIAKLPPEVANLEKSKFRGGLELHLAKTLGGLPVGEHGEIEGFSIAQEAALSAWRIAASMSLNALDRGIVTSQAFLKMGKLHQERMVKVLKK